MNQNHVKYDNFLKIKNNWPLDDWSINVECFEKIVEILPFDKKILELGSGKSTDILSKFYNMTSVESDKKYLNIYNSYYIHSEITSSGSYDFNNLKNKLKDLSYDLLLIDGPNDDRENILNYIEDFKTDIPIIWDDTQVYEKFAIEMAKKLNKNYTTFQCKPQGDFWKKFSGGKRFTLLTN